MKNMKKPLLSLITAVFTLLQWSESQAQLTMTVESGAALNGYNNVRYSNSGASKGTRFSLVDDFGDQNLKPFIRIEAKYQLRLRHTFELTAAPLSFDYSRLSGTVDFGNESYAGAGVNGRYEFNTYRLSYRYVIKDGIKWRIGLGATVLMRDARISLRQGSKFEETTDLGFVPLISFDVRYRATPALHLVLKGDALVGPQGRAEDVFLGINRSFWKPGMSFRFGYRLIEGGADVDQVYNFALIHFASVGVSYMF